MFMAMAAHELSDEDFEKLPSWSEVKDWPGKIIAVCDYKARDGLNLVLVGPLERKILTRPHPLPRQCRHVAIAQISRGKSSGSG